MNILRLFPPVSFLKLKKKRFFIQLWPVLTYYRLLFRSLVINRDP